MNSINTIKVRHLTRQEQKSFMQTTLKRVISINDIKIHDLREVYIDTNNVLFYRSQASRFKLMEYAVRKGKQCISLNGKIIAIDPKCDKIVYDENSQSPILEKGKIFRLINGVKVLIVDKIPKGDFADEDVWIGVYKNGTIRFDSNGQLMSHGQDIQWSIAEESKNISLWTVIISEGNNEYKSFTFDNKKVKDEFIKNNKFTVLSVTEVSI